VTLDSESVAPSLFRRLRQDHDPTNSPQGDLCLANPQTAPKLPSPVRE
jgi:hypothetical protein